MKAFTDTFQSCRLLQLGLDPCTADLWSARQENHEKETVVWNMPVFIVQDEEQDGVEETIRFFQENKDKIGSDILPRWSLAAILQLLPDCIRSHYVTRYTREPVVYWLTVDGTDSYSYTHIMDSYSLEKGTPLSLVTITGDCWTDTAFQLLAWLLENKYELRKTAERSQDELG